LGARAPGGGFLGRGKRIASNFSSCLTFGRIGTRRPTWPRRNQEGSHWPPSFCSCRSSAIVAIALRTILAGGQGKAGCERQMPHDFMPPSPGRLRGGKWLYHESRKRPGNDLATAGRPTTACLTKFRTGSSRATLDTHTRAGVHVFPSPVGRSASSPRNGSAVSEAYDGITIPRRDLATALGAVLPCHRRGFHNPPSPSNTRERARNALLFSSLPYSTVISCLENRAFSPSSFLPFSSALPPLAHIWREHRIHLVSLHAP